MKSACIIGILCSYLMCGIAKAQAPHFGISFSGINNFAPQETAVSFNEYTLSITGTANTGTPTITITPITGSTLVDFTTIHISTGSTAHYVSVTFTQNASQTGFTKVGGVSSGTGFLPMNLFIANVGQVGDSPTSRAQLTAGALNITAIRNVGIGLTGNIYADCNVIGTTTLAANVQTFHAGNDFVGTLLVGNVIEDLAVVGQLGSSTSPSTITGRLIYSISASSIQGAISTSGTDNLVARVKTTGSVAASPTSDTGVFRGSLTTLNFNPETVSNNAFIDVYGDLDANITIANDIAATEGSALGATIRVRNGEFKIGRTILVNRNILPPNTGTHGGIKVDGAGKLKGQVIIGNSNASGSPWAAPVSVDGIALSTLSGSPDTAPYYTRGSIDLGGGAVGLVPFQLKRNESSPESDCLYIPCDLSELGVIGYDNFTNTATGTGMTLSFYGPVQAGAGSPIIHLYRCNLSGWAETGTDYGSSCSVSFSGRNMKIYGPTSIGNTASRYVLYHAASEQGLVCGGLSSSTVPVAPFVYHFFLGATGQADGSCADFNGDGDVGTDADISAFFACLSGSCCSTCASADFNCDGNIGTDADIAWFFAVLSGAECNCPLP
jgi:hypothetical protein